MLLMFEQSFMRYECVSAATLGDVISIVNLQAVLSANVVCGTLQY